MDTTHIAYTAEDLISHKLQRAGLLVAKPKFDQESADLLVFMRIEDGAKFCRVQCKGRSLINSTSSNVAVPRNYVAGAFILLLFIDDGYEKETNLFCFFSEDIKKKWKLKTFKNSEKDYYRLSFSRPTFKDFKKQGNLIEHAFNVDKIEQIKEVIKKADIKKEFKKVFDLLKKQNELIDLQRKKYELEGLIKDIEHTEEVRNMLEDEIKILEEHYKDLENQIQIKEP